MRERSLLNNNHPSLEYSRLWFVNDTIRMHESVAAESYQHSKLSDSWF